MAFKQFHVDSIGQITVYKRRGARSLRLSIRHDGSLRVTVPPWMPYAAGVEFARSRQSWIAEHAVPAAEAIAEGQLIGKSHRVHFKRSAEASRTTTRLKGTEIIITYPAGLEASDPDVQAAAGRAALRALKTQAEHLLPIRLRELAREHGFNYRAVGVKQLKTRWGSCDSGRNITLNIFLMQLPWELIDYVLLHELNHTRIMKHGPEFWEAMTALDERSQRLRKDIRAYKPAL